MRNISDKSCGENKKSFFGVHSLIFPGNCAVYEKIWKNTVETDRPLITI